MPQPPNAALRLTTKKRKNSVIECTPNYSLRAGKSPSARSSFGISMRLHEFTVRPRGFFDGPGRRETTRLSAIMARMALSSFRGRWLRPPDSMPEFRDPLK